MASSTSIDPHRAGSGEPLVLIHGFTSSWRNWLPVLPTLEEHNDVLAVRLAGHYEAAAFPDGVDPSVASLAEAVERDMDLAGFECAHVVGNSLGGWIALELAKRGRAATVVAISPAGGWSPASPELRHLEQTLKASHKLAGWLAPHADTLMRSRLVRRVVFSRAAARPQRIAPEEAAYRVRALAGCSAFHALLATIGREAPPRGLDKVNCPVLLLWPTHDRILPKAPYAQYFLGALPEAELEEPDALGHVPTFDDPDVIAHSILSFIARHPIPGRHRAPLSPTLPVPARLSGGDAHPDVSASTVAEGEARAGPSHAVATGECQSDPPSLPRAIRRFRPTRNPPNRAAPLDVLLDVRAPRRPRKV